MTPEAFWCLLWGEDGYRHELHFTYDERNAVAWIPCEDRDRFCRLLDLPDCYVSAVPRQRKGDELSWGAAHFLWTSLNKTDSCRRLQAFRPAPTVVWREAKSSRRWAAWQLTAPLPSRWVQQATERLAHHLGGRRRDAQPHALIASPFSGRWAVEFETPTAYPVRQIVGGLRDAPDATAWRTAA